jgi:predicted O-linked N-acetylglucosamine transferase (SPINDLY family)
MPSTLPPLSVTDALIRAIELQNRQQPAEAARLFEAVLAVDPNNAAALYSLGVIALHAADHERALAVAQRGVQAAPAFAPLQMLLGSCLQRRGENAAALAAYDRALALQPGMLEALVNSGVLLRAMFRHHESLERFLKVLEIDPRHTIALANCGVILTEFKQSERAIGMFERLIAIDPHYDYAQGLLFYERAHLCDWRDFEAQRACITQAVLDGRRAIKSLAFMSLSDRASEHLLAARSFASHYCPPQPRPMWNGERYAHRKIRLAYVSPDLREHPVGHLMAGVFEAHDKSRFETIAISLGADDGSRLRARMLNAFDHFLDVRDWGSEQIARRMREMEVDIAVDLGGYTSDTRTEVFAWRPAPVQVNFLGYPGTMGVDYFDYILADRHVIPPGHEPYYTEQVARLPHTYLPTDASVRIAERTPSRAECGLPETGFVFCSFSHDYKISPPMFEVWMRLLRATPGSVLWLMSRGAASQANLRREAQARGVDPSRLVFAQRVPRVEDHLARYRQADLFLDTHPYNAHTTAADALMAGLPVITAMGQSFPSRVAGSLLHALGVPELATESFEAYEALALRLAANPQALVALRERIVAQRHTHALFDTAGFCRDLEAALAEMVSARHPVPPVDPVPSPVTEAACPSS